MAKYRIEPEFAVPLADWQGRPQGSRTVRAYVSGALAVHRRIIGKDYTSTDWVVCHVPTRRHIGSIAFRTLAQALAALVAIQPLTSWDLITVTTPINRQLRDDVLSTFVEHGGRRV